MIQIRLFAPCSREFQPDVYRPGVISVTRLLWGALGGGLTLALLAFLSKACEVAVLYPPLAATCFIGASCPHLRVARPRQVVVGHLVSSAAGLLVVALAATFPEAQQSVALKLGLAVGLATLLMQIFDADHPPAAATAVIPVLLPLPVAPLLLPLHMAWGGMVASLALLAWNRWWFDFPPPEAEVCTPCLGLRQGRAETLGLGVCALGTFSMALRPLWESLYSGGLGAMALGVLVLLFQHFATSRLATGTPDRS